MIPLPEKSFSGYQLDVSEKIESCIFFKIFIKSKKAIQCHYGSVRVNQGVLPKLFLPKNAKIYKVQHKNLNRNHTSLSKNFRLTPFRITGRTDTNAATVAQYFKMKNDESLKYGITSFRILFPNFVFISLKN